MAILSCIFIWALCGIIAWGLTLGHFTHNFEWQNHTGLAATMALSGPFGMIAAFVVSTIYHDLHIRFIPLSKEQRWVAFAKDFSVLGRDYFDKIS